MTAENGVQAYTAQWQEKLGWKLFPNRHLDIPQVEGMKDCLVQRTVCYVSWLDRVRLVISGKIEVTTKNATENVIGRVVTNSMAVVRPPSWLNRK